MVFNCESGEGGSSGRLIDAGEIADLIKEAIEKRQELEKVNEEFSVDFSELKAMKVDHENFGEYKNQMIEKIPPKLDEIEKRKEQISQFEISEVENKLAKLKKLHVFA